MPALLGMTWDHVRGVAPLTAAARTWAGADDSRSIRWDARPLKDFEDQDLAELTAAYDLVMLDHPFIGTAAERGLVVPVDEWVDEVFLEDQRANSVGRSHESYGWNGRQWALAVDAAAQVGAVRSDLLDALDEEPARTWVEVAAQAARLSNGALGPRMALPLNANHAYCAFLSVNRALHGPGFWPEGGLWRDDAAEAALETLRALVPGLHPVSLDSDPIRISDLMADGDEIACCPLMFGYSNYGRHGFRPHRLSFHDAPTGSEGRGSVLGGVGIAVSATSSERNAAAALARLIASPEFQTDGYVRADGQPAHEAAWTGALANELTGDFFTATRVTMDTALTRPRIAGHRAFQPAAGAVVHDVLTDDLSTAGAVSALRTLAGDLLGVR